MPTIKLGLPICTIAADATGAVGAPAIGVDAGGVLHIPPPAPAVTIQQVLGTLPTWLGASGTGDDSLTFAFNQAGFDAAAQSQVCPAIDAFPANVPTLAGDYAVVKDAAGNCKLVDAYRPVAWANAEAPVVIIPSSVVAAGPTQIAGDPTVSLSITNPHPTKQMAVLATVGMREVYFFGGGADNVVFCEYRVNGGAWTQVGLALGEARAANIFESNMYTHEKTFAQSLAPGATLTLEVRTFCFFQTTFNYAQIESAFHTLFGIVGDN